MTAADRNSSQAGKRVQTSYSNPKAFKITDGVLEAYRGSDAALTVPDSVTCIGKHAFSSNRTLRSIVIPDGVTVIDDCAFQECSRLRSITLPASLTGIGDSAFEGCVALTGITLPDTVTHLGEYAFSCCASLERIRIPDGISSIPKSAFEDCINLLQVSLSTHVTSIGRSAFENCKKLPAFRIPDSVAAIGAYAFAECESLRFITIPESVTMIGSCAFSHAGLTTITIPERTAVKADTLRGCYQLSELICSPAALETFRSQDLLHRYLLPDNERDTADLCLRLKNWTEKEAEMIEQKLKHSNRYTAMAYFAVKDRLYVFADAHNTTVHDAAHAFIWDYGLDCSGCRNWNISGKTYTAHLKDNMTFEISDEDGHLLAAIPDPTAEAELTRLRKNVQGAVLSHTILLESDFLHPKTTALKEWRDDYCAHSWLKQIAKQIVWQQGTRTFILDQDGTPVDAQGCPVILDEAGMVLQAHPVEMSAETAAAWQNYLVTRHIEQPYGQMSEPVIRNASFSRYRNCVVSPEDLAELQSQSPEDFADLRLDTEYSSPYMDVSIRYFGFSSYTRGINRIVTVLDRKIVKSYLLRNEFPDESLLESLTLTDLLQLIELLSSEDDCTSALAALLAYKEKRFPDTGSVFDEFSLD